MGASSGWTEYKFPADYAADYQNRITIDGSGRLASIDNSGQVFFSQSFEKPPKKLGSVMEVPAGTTWDGGECGFVGSNKLFTVGNLSKGQGARLSTVTGEFRLWNLDTGIVELNIPVDKDENSLKGVAVTAKGVIAISHGGSRNEPGLVDLYQVSDGKRIGRLLSSYAENESNVKVLMRRI
jgi:hypothetical protein